MKNIVRVVESIGAGYGYVKHHYPHKVGVVNGCYIFNNKLVHRAPLRGY